MINFKVYDVTAWLINKSKGNQTMKFGQVVEYNKRKIFLQKPDRRETMQTLFYFLKKLC